MSSESESDTEDLLDEPQLDTEIETETEIEIETEIETEIEPQELSDDDESVEEVDEIIIEHKKIEKLEIKKITTPKYLFKFEYVRIICLRACDIRNKINVNPEEAKRLAKKDLIEGKIDYTICRPLQDGTIEKWNLKDLYFKKK